MKHPVFQLLSLRLNAAASRLVQATEWVNRRADWLHRRSLNFCWWAFGDDRRVQ